MELDLTKTCEHCGKECFSPYFYEMHILIECDEAPKEHREHINGGELPGKTLQ